MRRRRNRKRKGCTRSDRRTVTQDLTLVKTYFYFCVCQKKFLDNILVITMDVHAAKHTCMLQIAKKYFRVKFINQFSTGKSQKSLDGNKT